MYHYVYRIDFFEKEEYYIGKHSTKALDDGYTGSGKLLQRKIKCGYPFEFKIVSFHETEKEALNAENKLLGDSWKNDPKCLNLTEGGKGNASHFRGMIKSEEHKRKISIANKKSKVGRALEACIENGRKGSLARKGQKDSEETKRKRNKSLSLATKNKPKPWLMKKFLIEGKQYVGMDIIAEKFQISRQTVHNRCKSKNWPNWVRL